MVVELRQNMDRQAWDATGCCPQTGKGTEPPPPHARPRTAAAPFNTSLAKPDQGGRRNTESAGTPKHSEQGTE